MSTLTRDAIEERLRASGERRLVITPLLSGRQLGCASVDVRLGNQFIVFRTHALSDFDAQQPGPHVRQFQERHVLPFGEPFVLHPGMLALGATFEFVSIPPDLECQVEGRSSWARVGLQIATANSVEPRFKGVITLELANVGTIPLRLYAGVRVAQLVFHAASPEAKETTHRKYHGTIGPEFSRVYKDVDFNVFKQPALE